MTMQKETVVTEIDRARLNEMIRSLRVVGDPFRAHLRELEDQLRRATVVPAARVGRDVVTMDSRVRLLDLDTRRPETFTLVYHGEAGMFGTRLSVLSPLGVRVLGSRVGDVIEWPVPCGVRRLRVQSVLYQPEAAGDCNV